MKPTIALFTGDPAGIGPELVAKILAEGSPQRDADILLIGARSVVDAGMQAANARFEYQAGAAERAPGGVRLVQWPRVDENGFTRGEVVGHVCLLEDRLRQQ